MGGARSDARYNRERVLEAARELFAERGADVEMKEIAERANVGIGTLYRNFETKNDLVAAILAEAVGSLEAAVAAAAEEPDIRAAIGSYIAGVCTVIERSGVVMRLIIEGAMPKSFEHPAFQGFAHQLDEVIARGVASGACRPDVDPRIAGSLLKGMLFPIPYLYLRASLSMQEIVSGYTDMVLRGIEAPGRTARTDQLLA